MVRVPVSILLAILTTFGLFWVMQALVNVSGELLDSKPSPKVEFVRLKKDTTPEPKKREPPKREKPEATPPPPQMNMAQNINPGEGVGEIIPMADTTAALGEATAIGAGGRDQGVVPLVRVEPEYPARAMSRRIEGWVDVLFTIGKAGNVEDPKVVRANPPGVFEQAALRAIRRWRYTPRIEDGKAVKQPGIGVRLTFKLPRS